ncbi:hypothetical protein GQ54DRAFT_35451 [Martensiomyces pterosporus]|nr:hypothetical protein GQ54DRAFT_35451 [Martensiomyces pterosporus]
MLTHRKNWCRVCGTCLTCPRTRQSQFQRGTCKCEERQASHVPPKRVKSESLLSFRYRHLSAEDIDILEEIRPRFQFPTLPIERALVRANICSTCQQRLRRARLARCRQARPAGPKDSTQAPAESSAASDSDKSVGALLSSTFCAADDAPQNNTPSYSRFGGIGASADAAFQAHRSELRSTFTTSAYQPSAMQLIEKRGGAEQRIAADKAQIDSTAMSAADNTQGSLDWKLRSAAFGGAEMEAAAAPRFQHQCQQQCHFPVVQPLRPHPEPQPREQAGTAPSAFERSDLYEASVEELDATHVDLEESGQMVGDWHRLLPVPNSGSASGYEGMLYDHNASLSTPLFAQRYAQRTLLRAIAPTHAAAVNP